MSGNRSDDESWSSSADGENDDDDNDYSDDGQEVLTFYPICCQDTTVGAPSFGSLAAALEYDKETSGFDFLGLLPSAADEDFYERAIILVNMSRSFVTEHNDEHDIGSKLKEYLATKQTQGVEADEKFYKPALDDDAVLMCLDDLEDLKRKQEVGQNVTTSKGVGDGALEVVSQADRAEHLCAKISALEEQLARAKSCIATLTKEDGHDRETKEPPKRPDNDTYYFSSYSSHYIHETMLKDTVRTNSYEKAILSNADTLFKGKVVLDIGCGTGILSIFAAKAAAQKVIAIDGSDIIKEAQNIVDLNGFGGTIICVSGMVEKLLENNELPLGPDEKVDVIVSEWMGYALFFETMLPSVMKARDAIMHPKGTMYPNGATIFLEGASDPRLAFWKNVYGIDMTPMKSRVARELTAQAGVEVVDAEEITTDRVALIGFDLNTCKDEELDFEMPFELRPKVTKDGTSVRIDKLVVSFDIDFNVPGTKAVSFSTGSQTQSTHWKQAVLWFDPLADKLEIAEGELLRGNFIMGRNVENHREMDFVVMWEVGRVGESDVFDRKCDGVIKTTLSA